MKTSATSALLLLALLPACRREEPSSHGPTAVQDRADARPAARKPEILPPGKRRVIELEGGVRVEVLAEGEGAVVAPGDEVSLSLKLVYVPPAPAPSAPASGDGKDAAPKGTHEEAGTSKPGPAASKTGEQALEHAAPKGEHHAAESAPGGPVAAAVEAQPADGAHGAEIPASAPETGAHAEPAQAEPAQPSQAAAAEGAPSEPTATAPAPQPLAPPLEPVVLADTSAAGAPIRARAGSSSTLLPALSRALVGLRQGTIVEITLPPEAAYGKAGLPAAGIPAGATLTATLEIRGVSR